MSCSGSDGENSHLPNVILIALDTVRADHIGVYGNEWIDTPALDAFAREAVLFERAFAAAPWTLPSFASLYTGLLPSEHGVCGGKNHNQLVAENYTLVEYLGDHGYHAKGFVAIDYLTSRFAMDQGFDDMEEFLKGPVTGRIETYEDRVFSFVSDPPQHPYFLLVHYFDSHAPYSPPAPFDEMYYQGDARRVGNDSLDVLYDERNLITRNREHLYGWLEGVTDIEYPVKQYAAGVSHVDEHVGALLDHLRETGELDRSIVIITADHGEHLTEHDLYFSHRYPYEETLRIPLMIRLPKGAHGNRCIKDKVSNIDVLPTLADLLGLPLERGCTGISLLPLISGEESGVEDRYLFAEFGTPNKYTRAVWIDRFRLIHHERYPATKEEKYELYDHALDPREEHDVKDKFPEVFELLKSALTTRFAAYKDPARSPGPAEKLDLPEDVRKRLEQLGY